MRENVLFRALFCSAICIFTIVVTAEAQFPVKIPKINKPKPEQSPVSKSAPPETPSSEQPQAKPLSGNSKRVYQLEKPPASGAFLKNSVYVQAASHRQYWKMPKETKFSSWVPKIEFDLYISLDGGEAPEFEAQYFNPDGSMWFAEKLIKGSRGADKTVRYRSDPSETPTVLETKSTNATGVYGVKVTNKTTGETAFQGKFKVGKFLPEYRGRNEFDFYVEHDWLLPFGYVGFHHSALTDDAGGFQVIPSVWIKGDVSDSDLEARAFFGGKQIASTKDDSKSGATDAGERTSEGGIYAKDLHYWRLWQFQFNNLRFANGGDFNREYYPKAHYVDENPGEYTIKIFVKGADARELKFTVGADAKLADGGFAKQIFLPNYKILVPVKVTGEKWNQTAWKTDAFYANPLTGFAAP